MPTGHHTRGREAERKNIKPKDQSPTCPSLAWLWEKRELVWASQKCALHPRVGSHHFPNSVDFASRVPTLKKPWLLPGGDESKQRASVASISSGCSFLWSHLQIKIKPHQEKAPLPDFMLSWLSPSLRSSKRLLSKSFKSSPSALMSSQGNCSLLWG